MRHQAKPTQVKKIIRSDRKISLYSSTFLLQRISSFILILIATSCNKNEDRHINGEIFNAGSIFSDETHLITKRFEIYNESSRVIKVNHERCSCNCSNATLTNPSIPVHCSTYLGIIVHVRESLFAILPIQTSLRIEETEISFG